MRFSGFSHKTFCHTAICLAWLAIATQVRAQSFVDRLRTATAADLASLHEEFDVPRGDVDGNGEVSFADFLVLYENYGLSVDDLTYLEGDLNLDGTIDLGDFGMHSINFGTGSFEPDPPSRPANASLGLSRDDNGSLIISSAKLVELVAVEVVTESGVIDSPFFDIRERRPDSDPFTFTLDSEPNRVAWGNLGSHVKLQGDFPISSSSSASDLEVRWIEPGSFDVYSLAVGAGDGLTGNVIAGFRPPELSSIDFRSFDAAVNLDEVLAIHEEQNVPRGELDGFGAVSLDDIRVLRRKWGSEAKYTQGDLNLDGTVGLGDLAILLANIDRDEWVADEERIIDDPADLTLFADEFGRLHLASDKEVALGSIELQMDTENDVRFSSQVHVQSEGLFDRQLVDTAEVLVLGNLSNSAPMISAETALGIRLDPGTRRDVTLRWIEAGSYSVFESGPVAISYEPEGRLGDVDADGYVDFNDFLILSHEYGAAVEPSTRSDFTGDGRVNFYDFLILSYNFGQFFPQNAEQVPEPLFGFQYGLLVAFGLAFRLRIPRSQTSQTSTA